MRENGEEEEQDEDGEDLTSHLSGAKCSQIDCDPSTLWMESLAEQSLILALVRLC